jgi:hypothetical protein
MIGTRIVIGLFSTGIVIDEIVIIDTVFRRSGRDKYPIFCIPLEFVIGEWVGVGKLQINAMVILAAVIARELVGVGIRQPNATEVPVAGVIRERVGV